MHSTGILRTKSAVVISAILATGLILTGCGGGGDDPKTSMPDVMEPETSMPDVMEPETSMPDVMEPGTGPTDMSDLGEWEIVRANGVPVGNEHTGYDLFARFDARGANPTISASSPMHQPTVAGTWSGKWSARYTALTSDYGDFDETDDGIARINVTITGGNVDAVVNSPILALMFQVSLPRYLLDFALRSVMADLRQALPCPFRQNLEGRCREP